MRPEIWYREELVVLSSIVNDAIRRTNPSDVESMVSLGHLSLKLDEAIKVAPSATTPEAKS